MLKFLGGALTKNLGSKILSVLLGLVVWFHVSRQVNPTVKETVVAEVRVANAGVDLLPTVSPAQVKVTISDYRSELREMEPYLRKLEAVVDVTGKGVGTYEEKPRVEGLPSGIGRGAVRIDPEKVQVRLEKLSSKTLPVSWVAAKPPPPGIEIGEPVIRPGAVTVGGLADDLQVVARAQVEVELEEVEKGNTLWVPVRLYEASGRRINNPGIFVEPSLVSVIAPIREVLTKVVPVVPQIEKGGEGFDIKAVKVSPAVVTLSGPATALAGITSISTEMLTVSGRQETESLTAKLELPAEVRLIGGAEKVQVTITTAKSTLPAGNPSKGDQGGAGG